MACGDMFLGEVVTVDGYTTENPYGIVAIPGDYDGWRELAEKIYERLDAHWQQLGEIEPSPFEFWNAHVEHKNELQEKLDDLPWTVTAAITGQLLGGYIDDCITLILEINCLREGVFDRILALGEDPEDLPETGTPDEATKPSDWMPSVVTGLFVVAGIYVGARFIVPAVMKGR